MQLSAITASLGRFFAELQRRKVLRIAAGYIVGAWIVLQVALALQTAMSLSGQFSAAILALLVIGFFVTLVLAWFYEITPEGVKRTAPATGDAPLVKPQTTDLILAGALALVFCIGAVQFLWPDATTAPADPAVGAAKTGATTREVAEAEKPKTDAPPHNSIAVLPFANLSADKDNAYFAIGIQDEILTRLTKVGSLHVISRTSSASLASKPDNLPEIARKLNVAFVVEGSVQREGKSVRIQAQLIDAASDSHMWAETYERSVDNVFKVEAEVATDIAKALHAKLTSSDERALTAIGTHNSAAFDAYLRARALFASGPSTEALEPASAKLRQAVKLDPNFAQAWALLSQTEGLIFFWNIDQTDVRRLAARSALDRALQLQPGLPEVQLAEAVYEYRVSLNYSEAARKLDRVLLSWPNNEQVHKIRGSIARRLGHWEEGRSHLEKAALLSPLAIDLRQDLARTLVLMREYDNALKAVDAGLDLRPDDEQLLTVKLTILDARGDLAAADAVVARLRPTPMSDVVGQIADHALLKRDYSATIDLIGKLFADAQSQDAPAVIKGELALRLGALEQFAGRQEAADKHLLLARQILTSVLAEQPDNWSAATDLALIYAAQGDRGALGYVERAMRAKQISQDKLLRLGLEWIRVLVWSLLGDRDHAIPALARLLNARGIVVTPAYLRLHPAFDKLRDDPRFQALLAKSSATPTNAPHP